MCKIQPKEGNVVIVKTESKNRGTWPLATVKKTYVGKDEIIRGFELQTANGKLDRPVQFLNPLQLACDAKPAMKDANLNPKAPGFRPKRSAAEAARVRIRQIQEIKESVI